MTEEPPMSGYAATAQTAAHQQQSILTATPGKLVVMLYDGAVRFLKQAAAAMRDERRAQADERLRRADAIIEELQLTLDLEAGEIASNLQGIYVFSRRHLNEARVERDPEKVDQVAGLLSELRGSWAQIAGS
jgi:flagellar secretion chaperone FliS